MTPLFAALCSTRNCALLLPFFLMVVTLGCANSCLPILGDRQTIPPPATNSYLNQSNGTIPVQDVLTTGLQENTTGSANNSTGAVTFQTATVAPPVTSLATIPTASTAIERELSAQPTSQTAFQNLEARSHSKTRTTEEGRTVTMPADPNAPSISASQIITHVTAEKTTEQTPNSKQ